jgi:deoxycytidylate deaminase
MLQCKKYNIKATVYDRRGNILSTGVNDYNKTHPKQKILANRVGLPEKEFLHAEISAIIRALKVGVPYKIKVERYGKTGNPLNAEPCPICKLCIKESGIKLVEYTMS